MWVDFAFAKATHIFFSKNTCELVIVLTRTINSLTINDLVKLTTLWPIRLRIINWVVSDETAFYEPSHPDLHRLQRYILVRMGENCSAYHAGQKFQQAIFPFFFSYFSQKILFDISCTLSPKETICKKYQILLRRQFACNVKFYFLGKTRKKIINLSFTEFSHSVIQVR